MAVPNEQKYLLSPLEARDDAIPGLIRKLDGTVWLVNPDGSRTQLPGGGGGGCVYFTCDTDNGVAEVNAPNQIVAIVAPEAAGVNPNISVQVTDFDGGSQRAILEAGVVGDTDETGYVNATAQNAAADVSASLALVGSDADGGTAALAATDSITIDSRQTVVSGHATLADDDVDSSLASLDELGRTRTSFEGVYSGGAGQGTARMLAQEPDDNTAAILTLFAATGEPSSASLRADLLSFDAAASPIARPAVNPATVTAQEIAEGLIALGIFTEAL